jgi:SAM-dependent methyltransferase
MQHTTVRPLVDGLFHDVIDTVKRTVCTNVTCEVKKNLQQLHPIQACFLLDIIHHDLICFSALATSPFHEKMKNFFLALYITHTAHSYVVIPSQSITINAAIKPTCLSSAFHRWSTIARNSHQSSYLMSDSTSWEEHDHDEEDDEDSLIRMTSTTHSILNKNYPFQSSTDSNTSPIYSVPALYDLASSYRNYEEEVRFLLWAQSNMGKTIKSPTGYRILELAAGPARHSLTALTSFSHQVASCTAIDSSHDMVQYAQSIAEEQLPTQTKSFTYILGDMRFMNSTTLNHDFDAVWLISGSMSHLLTHQDVVDCFQSTLALLQPGGLFMLEQPHPKEIFGMIECTRNGWDIPLQDQHGKDCGTVHVIWGDAEDSLDPIRQIRNMTLSIEWKGFETSSRSTTNMKKRNKMTRTTNSGKAQGFGNRLSEDIGPVGTVEPDKPRSVHDIVPMRSFTMQEIYALANLVGFEVVGTYGALDEELDIHNEDAFRMVCVLRKPNL